jgi:hypothetical protein
MEPIKSSDGKFMALISWFFKLPMKRIGVYLGLASLSLLSACAGIGQKAPQSSDYALEQRWAQEFAPGIVVGDVVRITQPSGHRFAAAWAPTADSKRTVILLHGLGVHPEHGLTGELRALLHDAGFATLAIQTPVIDSKTISDAGVYRSLMPEAAERIDAAISFTRQQGAKQVFLVGHTVGAWMINEFFKERPAQALTAWASLGYTGRFDSFGQQTLATLDIYPDQGPPVSRDAAPSRIARATKINPRSEQLLVQGTDLNFSGKDKQIANAIAIFFAKF